MSPPSPLGCPGLSEVMAVALKVVSSSGVAPARLVMDGLFAHFFSPDRHSYAHEDVLWFLKLANQQELWCHVEGSSHQASGGVQHGCTEDRDEASKLLMMVSTTSILIGREKCM